MNAVMKHRELTPGRQALANVITKLQAHRTTDAAVLGEIKSLKAVVDAESEVQRELDAIAETERREILAWAEAGSIGTQPALHDRARQSVTKRLRAASAKAEAARSRIQVIEQQRTQAHAGYAQLVADLNTARLAVLVEIAQAVGVEFKSVLAQAYLLESQLKAIEHTLTAHGGDFMAAHNQWSGNPADMRKAATDRAIDLVSRLFVELNHNPEATLTCD